VQRASLPRPCHLRVGSHSKTKIMHPQAWPRHVQTALTWLMASTAWFANTPTHSGRLMASSACMRAHVAAGCVGGGWRLGTVRLDQLSADAMACTQPWALVRCGGMELHTRSRARSVTVLPGTRPAVRRTASTMTLAVLPATCTHGKDSYGPSFSQQDESPGPHSLGSATPCGAHPRP
jgi:hypothetical protein